MDTIKQYTRPGRNSECFILPAINNRDWHEYVKQLPDNDWEQASPNIQGLTNKRKSRLEWRLDAELLKSQFISTVEVEFNRLAERWESETGALSITSSKINDTYLKIIALGNDVVPHILKKLLSPYSSAAWHTALRILTDRNPVEPEEMNDPKRIKARWIDWGKQQKLI